MNLVEHLKKSIDSANNFSSKINSDILSIPGMSSPKVRHFLNNVVNFPSCRYLEIGCWKGSTIISALYQNNPEKFWVIDNFKEFGNVKDEFNKNYESNIIRPLNLIEEDFLTVDLNKTDISNVNVYFYDGNHTDESHKQALKHYYYSLSNEFIFIVDDWNWEIVKNSTLNVIKELKFTVLYESVLPAALEGQDMDQWWNGVYAVVLKKPNE